MADWVFGFNVWLLSDLGAPPCGTKESAEDIQCTSPGKKILAAPGHFSEGTAQSTRSAEKPADFQRKRIFFTPDRRLSPCLNHAFLHDGPMHRLMNLIEELRGQLSGAPEQHPTSMEGLAGIFRDGETGSLQFSQSETRSETMIVEDHTDPDMQLEMRAHDIARRWVEARRMQGHLAD